MTQREPGEWVASGQRGRRLDGGKISRQDRWWPLRWWRGHWLRHRRTDGEWATRGRGRGQSTTGRRRTAAQRSAAEYQLYLESRYQQADAATSGNAPSAYFTGRPRSVNTAPEELRDWFRAHGRNLSASEFRQQHDETHGAPGYPY